MIYTRKELDFDFHGAQFDLSRVEERQLLGWIFNQFLYGEVTGIQCGYWLYRAPSLRAASFLARQAAEELSHVKRIAKILQLLDEKPAPANGAIKFLATGMMGGSWGNHVTLEMAIGEGLVLHIFYALARTIPHTEIHNLIESAIVDEEKHVDFGEREAAAWAKAHSLERWALLGMVLIQVWTLKRLKRFVVRSVMSDQFRTHPVLSQFDSFYDHILKYLERRTMAIGISPVSVSELSLFSKWVAIVAIPFSKVAYFFSKKRLVTSTYLEDPFVLGKNADD